MRGGDLRVLCSVFQGSGAAAVGFVVRGVHGGVKR